MLATYLYCSKLFACASIFCFILISCDSLHTTIYLEIPSLADLYIYLHLAACPIFVSRIQ